jgi:hypothetical protein
MIVKEDLNLRKNKNVEETIVASTPIVPSKGTEKTLPSKISNEASTMPKDNSNRSFASPKLEILKPLEFNENITPIDCIIFVHPPKTGGTNLVFLAEAMAKLNPTFKVRRFGVPRTPGQSPNKITENWVGGFGSLEIAMKTDADPCKDLNFISGHFPFGLHEKTKKPAKYLALIRNPIERELSSANFDFQRSYVTKDASSHYLCDETIDNPQVRLLAGQAYMSGACTTAVLVKAKENINKHFLMVGITEDTNAFIQIFASIQKWAPIAIHRAQVTGEKVFKEASTENDKPLVDENSKYLAEIKKKLAQKHAFDLQLYDWVKVRWNEWKKKIIKREIQVLDTQEMTCITYEFANNKTPVRMTQAKIVEYNSKLSAELVEITQNPSGVIAAVPMSVTVGSSLKEKAENEACKPKSITVTFDAMTVIKKPDNGVSGTTFQKTKGL